MSTPAKKSIPFRLRDATVHDALAISLLGGHVFKQTFKHSMPKEDMTAYLETSWTLEAVQEDLTSPNILPVVAVTQTKFIQEGQKTKGLCLPEVITGEEEIVVGFVILRKESYEPCLEMYKHSMIELQRIYVHPMFKGMRIGSALIEKGEAMARDEKFKFVWLGVWEENYIAQNLYFGRGYKKVGSHPFVMGDCVQTDWIVVKEL